MAARLRMAAQQGGYDCVESEASAVAGAARERVLPVARRDGPAARRVVVCRKGQTRGGPRGRKALHLDRIDGGARCAGCRCLRCRKGLSSEAFCHADVRLVAELRPLFGSLSPLIMPGRAALGAGVGGGWRCCAPVKQERALLPGSTPLRRRRSQTFRVVEVGDVDVRLLCPDGDCRRAPEEEPLGHPPPHAAVGRFDRSERAQADRLLLAGHEGGDGVPPPGGDQVAAITLVVEAVGLVAFARPEIAREGPSPRLDEGIPDAPAPVADGEVPLALGGALRGA
eukprot:293099-Pleurochrysis_carterae.AAC.1